MVDKLKTGIEKLETLNKQRIIWLRLSGFVVIAILAIIFDWHYVQDTKWEFLVFSSGMILSVLWWYWTMIILRHLIEQKKAESAVIIDIVEDIREIKESVKKSTTDIDKVK